MASIEVPDGAAAESLAGLQAADNSRIRQIRPSEETDE